MRITAQILTFILFSLFIVGCSITEEITFNANGSVHYSCLMDGSAIMGILPDSISQDDKTPKDTLITFYDALKLREDSISRLPEEDQKKLKALKLLNIKVHHDKEKKEYLLQMLGDFTDTNSLNLTLSALGMEHLEGGKIKKPVFLSNMVYDWNGKELIKTSVVPKSMEEDSLSEDSLSSAHMFEIVKFQTKYNFPRKIKKVSDPSALISQDGKSVIVEYDVSEYAKHPEKNNLKVELED
ncbi:MAG: hypothetical protein LBP34_09355 [Flavobacteriaceae bacterium]|jgi:hypothetical protein|nr:hypothetical protein [Flavobacteriaceae bacterium]